MNIAQAAGMAAAMCVELNCQPRNLPVRALQKALLKDVQAPASIVPLFNSLPNHPDWLIKQLYYLDNLHDYSANGNYPDTSNFKYSYGEHNTVQLLNGYCFKGICQRIHQQDYRFEITAPTVYKGCIYQLVTLKPHIDLALKALPDEEELLIFSRINHAGNWLLVEHII